MGEKGKQMAWESKKMGGSEVVIQPEIQYGKVGWGIRSFSNFDSTGIFMLLFLY